MSQYNTDLINQSSTRNSGIEQISGAISILFKSVEGLVQSLCICVQCCDHKVDKSLDFNLCDDIEVHIKVC